MSFVKTDVTKAAGALQLCSGQESGSEAALHAMQDIFEDNKTEVVLLVDATNAFNSINRKASLHNIDISCPAISIYIYNCYVVPARLFIIGGKEIPSTEGTTHGDPTAMATYALGLTPMMDSLLLDISEPNRPKMAVFADDLTVAGKLTQIKTWWEHMKKIGPKYGYDPQTVKSFLIVKEQYAQNARALFNDTDIKVTYAGKRHLGAVVDSQEYTSEYVNELVSC